MTPAIQITPTRLDRADHAQAWLALLDHYACDPMGGERGLSEFALRHLVERLQQRADFVGFLAWRGARAVGLINCFEGFSTFAARPLLNIHDLVVLAGQRGGGIGQQLLSAAEAAQYTQAYDRALGSAYPLHGTFIIMEIIVIGQPKFKFKKL